MAVLGRALLPLLVLVCLPQTAFASDIMHARAISMKWIE